MPKPDALVLDDDQPLRLRWSERIDGEGCLSDRLARLKELGESSFGIDGGDQQQRAEWRAQI